MDFSGYSRFPRTNKTDCHEITEILLKVAVNTITLILTPSSFSARLGLQEDLEDMKKEEEEMKRKAVAKKKRK
jgi:hypothetical protein